MLSIYSPWKAERDISFPASHSVVDSSLLESFRSSPTSMVHMAPQVWDAEVTGAQKSWVVPGKIG